MIDGIIQQVFNKYLIGGEFKSDYVITNRKLELIQQELIEKIRQWDKENRGYYPYHISLKDLIGDNQE